MPAVQIVMLRSDGIQIMTALAGLCDHIRTRTGRETLLRQGGDRRGQQGAKSDGN